MTTQADRFSGCLLGLALGDALGARFEGGLLERSLWRLIGKTRAGEMRWTDDTQMSLDLAESLIERGRVDPDDLAPRFARSYRWSRGYGPGAAKLLKRIARGEPWRQASRSVFRDGSYGNGGAMRAPIVGLFYADRPEELVDAARDSARVTHAHPLGLEGAVLVAAATTRALSTTSPAEILEFGGRLCEANPFRSRLEIARDWIDSDQLPGPKVVAKQLGNGMEAATSVVTAVYLGLRFLHAPFHELQIFVSRCGGDADTIGAMSGAVWGAANGMSSLPEASLSRLEQRTRLLRVAETLHRVSNANGPDAQMGAGPGRGEYE